MGMMRKVPCQTTVAFPLTQEERTQRACLAADAIRERAQIADRYATVRAEWRATFAAIDTKIEKLTTEYTTGIEERTVDAVAVYDLDSGTMWEEFEGKRYNTRPMSAADKETAINIPLFDEEKISITKKPEKRKPEGNERNGIGGR